MPKAPKILVIDVGGTHIKAIATGHKNRIRFASGPTMTPARMVKEVLKATEGWEFEVVSIGYPGPVVDGQPARNPYNLGGGWVRFDFQKAFGRPVRILNDAAMQALGSYDGGRMLFLGLGTGLGSAMVAGGSLDPLELAHLPYRRGRSYEDYAGIGGLKRLGVQRWRKHVRKIAGMLHDALQVDYVVLGGGNAKKVGELPPNCRLGANSNAFLGGFRLWREQQEHKSAMARNKRGTKIATTI
jgi:predicted NBD/HSP70 family sugar kinase